MQRMKRGRVYIPENLQAAVSCSQGLTNMVQRCSNFLKILLVRRSALFIRTFGLSPDLC